MSDKKNNPKSNYEAALAAERKKVTRCFHKYTSEQRANLAANIRAGHQQREAIGAYFYAHPALPNIAFPTRIAAARAALTATRSAS